MTSEDAPPPVEVARAANLFEARLMTGLLESHDITAHIPGESTLETYDGAATIWAGGVPIMVPGDLADEARRVLADNASRTDPDDASHPDD